MDEGKHDDFDDIPVAELTDEREQWTPRPRPARDHRRTLLLPVACIAVAVIAAGFFVANRNDDGMTLPSAKVVAALDTTTAMHSFDFHAKLSEAVSAPPTTPAADCPPAVSKNGRYPGAGNITLCGATLVPPPGTTISSSGTMTLDPLALTSVTDVPGLGPIRTWVNSTTVWEQGGGNYGLPAGGSLDGFADLVNSMLGSRQGSVAMMSLASPTGYLNVARDAITDASKLGTSTVDGERVTRYQVTVDAARLVDRPGMSTEQRNTSIRAFDQLKEQGYVDSTVQLAIDKRGLIRTSATVVRFRDGGSVTETASFSHFGCGEPIVFPDQFDPAMSSCDAPTTTTSTTTTTTPLRGEVFARGTFSGTERFAFYDGRCPELDHHLDAAFLVDTGAQWRYYADYCGTINAAQVWNGEGTFTFTLPDGSTMTGDFTSSAQLPSPGVPYSLHIRAPFAASCRIDNHLTPLSFGVQEQNGTFTCVK
jgi:hypothetical protein